MLIIGRRYFELSCDLQGCTCIEQQLTVSDYRGRRRHCQYILFCTDLKRRTRTKLKRVQALVLRSRDRISTSGGNSSVVACSRCEAFVPNLSPRKKAHRLDLSIRKARSLTSACRPQLRW